MLIQAKGLSKIYGSGENQVVALDKANLTIAPGDFISIIGPSGSGKSTLLHLLSGLDHPASGSLTYDGQQQRVAIARALIAQPEVIFADEPTGNLDSKSGGEVMELLKGIRERMGKTLVIITHDNRIAAAADRQLTIMDGVLSEVEAG